MTCQSLDCYDAAEPGGCWCRKHAEIARLRRREYKGAMTNVTTIINWLSALPEHAHVGVAKDGVTLVSDDLASLTIGRTRLPQAPPRIIAGKWHPALCRCPECKTKQESR
jgi:hypothetical protein